VVGDASVAPGLVAPMRHEGRVGLEANKEEDEEEEEEEEEDTRRGRRGRVATDEGLCGAEVTCR